MLGAVFGGTRRRRRRLGRVTVRAMTLVTPPATRACGARRGALASGFSFRDTGRRGRRSRSSAPSRGSSSPVAHGAADHWSDRLSLPAIPRSRYVHDAYGGEDIVQNAEIWALPCNLVTPLIGRTTGHNGRLKPFDVLFYFRRLRAHSARPREPLRMWITLALLVLAAVPVVVRLEAGNRAPNRSSTPKEQQPGRRREDDWTVRAATATSSASTVVGQPRPRPLRAAGGESPRSSFAHLFIREPAAQRYSSSREWHLHERLRATVAAERSRTRAFDRAAPRR